LSNSVGTGRSFLLRSGKFTNRFSHHTPAAAELLKAVGIEVPYHEALPTFLRESGALRIEAGHGRLHVELQGDITRAQLLSIGESLDAYSTLIYDIYAPDGERKAHGSGFLEFLDEPLLVEAERRGRQPRWIDPAG
jgi:hypothetical protein